MDLNLFENNVILSVSELTRRIKKTLEENFSQITVEGEISNFKAHISGHWYFSLKDTDAAISCMMWKGMNNYVFFTPQDGMKVIVKGRITVYPPRGNYQIEVRSMQPSGIGELQAAFEKLKAKLSAEGLFDEKYKKPIPAFPKRIGIVTAIDGAAFRDMISVAKRRFPLVELVIAPSKVQGSGSAESIAKSIAQLNKEKNIDVIIVGRGGGSIEDLWAFNEEIVARSIFYSNIPIISGVGHEIDFTIADYVADLRAPTPSAAMEIATPNLVEIFAFINEFSYNSTYFMLNLLKAKKDNVLAQLNSYGFKTPENLLNQYEQQLDISIYKISGSIDKILLKNKNKINLFAKSIEQYDVKKNLKRGFALVKQNNQIVTRATDFNKNLESVLRFYDGDVHLLTNKEKND